MAKVKQPKKTEIEKILSKEEIELLNNSFTYENHHNYWKRNKAIFAFFLNSGLRVGEFAQLKVYDVMSPNGQVKDILVVRGETAKRGKTRHVPLNAIAKQAIQDLLEKREVEFTDSVAVHLDGKTPMGRRAVQDMVTSTFKKAGITRLLSVHNLRHHFLSAVYRKTRNIKITSQLAGHSQASLTMSLYCHASLDEMSDAVKKLTEDL